MRRSFLSSSWLFLALLAATPTALAHRLHPLVTIDLAPVALVAPAPGPACYTNAETVTVRVQNVGTNTLNFATNNATVTVNVTGAVTQLFNRVVNTGTLAPGATLNVNLPGTLNMTPLGTYNFAVTGTVAGDLNPANNNLVPPPTRTVAAPAVGTASATPTIMCGPPVGPMLSVTSFAGGPLQWESSPTGLAGSFTALPGSTNQNPFSAPVVTATTFYRAKVTCGPQPISNVVTVTVPTATTWTGNLNTDWFNQGNWTTCVPTPTLDVLIPAGRPNYPVITTGNTGAHNLTINAGGSMTMNSDTLEVRGNFVNNGSFQQNDGWIHMKGPSPQQIGGTSPITFHHLTIGGQNVTLTSPIQMRQMLTLAGPGNLILAGNALTILSDNVATGMVVNVGTGVVVGNTAHVRRFLTPSASGSVYHHFSAPLSDATFTGLNALGYTPVVNAAYNTAPNPLAVRPYPNVFGFDESRFPADTDFVKGYYSPAALTDPMVIGKGYSLFMPSTIGIEFVGTLNTGDVSQSLTQTGGFLGPTQKSGWHLLGNPYPGPIQWDSVTFPAGMSHATSIYKPVAPTAGTYRTRVNGVGPLYGGDDKIPMCQGFFVRTLVTVLARPGSTNSGGFTLTSSSRTTTYTSPPQHRPQRDQRPMIGLTLRTTGTSLADADQAWLYFQNGATAGLDLEYDGEKPQHNQGMPTLLSLTAAADELAVNGLPLADLQTGTTIPLLLDLPAAGSYTLEATNLLNLATTPVALLDHLTGTRYDFTTQPVITFSATAPGATRTRFALEIGHRPNGITPDATGATLALYPNPARDVVQVRLSQPTTLIQLLDATGRVLRTQRATGGSATLSLAGLPAGFYAVRAGTLTQHLIVE